MALGLAHQELNNSPTQLHTDNPASIIELQDKPHSLFPPGGGDNMEEVDYESLPTDKLSAHLMAGAAAGMMEHCVMYPVDCVKVCVHACVKVCVHVHAFVKCICREQVPQTY